MIVMIYSSLNYLSFSDLHLLFVIGAAEFENSVKIFNPHFETDFNLFLSFSAKPYLVECGRA